jgi:4-amino-4-deoxy-L-arabinose transferase-like glycosyltransferase
MDKFEQYLSTRNILIGFFLVFLFHILILFWIVPEIVEAFPNIHLVNVLTEGYDKIAMNLLEGNGYRVFPETSETLLRQPVYVLVQTGLFSVFGKSLNAVKFANIIFVFAGAYVIYLLAQKILSNRLMVVAVPLIYLMHPATIFAESRGGIESIFTLAILVSVSVMYRAIEENTWKWYAIFGVVLGLTALTRSTPMVMPVFLFAYLIIKNRAVQPALGHIVVVVITMSLVLSPWVVRNYSLTGIATPSETILGISAYNGLYINRHVLSAKDGFELLVESVNEQHEIANELGLPHKKGFIQYFYSVDDEMQFNKHLVGLVVNEYKESPLLLVKNMMLNFVRFWFHGGVGAATIINIIITLPLVALATAGCYLGIKRRMYIGPMLLFMSVIILAHMAILGVSRHHVPLIPFLLILACIPFLRGNSHIEQTT